MTSSAGRDVITGRWPGFFDLKLTFSKQVCTNTSSQNVFKPSMPPKLPVVISTHLSTKTRILWGHENCGHAHISQLTPDRTLKLWTVVQCHKWITFQACSNVLQAQQGENELSHGLWHTVLMAKCVGHKFPPWERGTRLVDLNVFRMAWNTFTNHFWSIPINFTWFWNFWWWRHQQVVTSSQSVDQVFWP